mmetsp:Transcript_52609/g.139709  ORF Transcript_52609/g.139709 Transcript_52609/m.139709 type:complete len:91 (-) Transcript_52609:1598-1870(-)
MLRLLCLCAAVFGAVLRGSVDTVEDALVDKANTTLRSPKVFLLFMTLDSMPHQNIWRRWLDRAPPGQYKAYHPEAKFSSPWHGTLKDPSC